MLVHVDLWRRKLLKGMCFETGTELQANSMPPQFSSSLISLPVIHNNQAQGNSLPSGRPPINLADGLFSHQLIAMCLHIVMAEGKNEEFAY